MEGTNRLHELREYGRMQWLDTARGWRAEPDDVMNALAADGFQECKRETARVPRAPATGGVWQGIDKTGAVASTVWTREPDGALLVFITINGEPLQGPR
jgi:hypothetical protein